MIPASKHVLTLALLTVILLHGGATFSQTFYNLGDANSDGWCNFGDVVSISEYLQGHNCGNFCIVGADADGNGSVNGIDATYLTAFLSGLGSAPIFPCPCPMMTCDPDQSGAVDIIPMEDSNPQTATFHVSIKCSALISSFHFSVIYDPARVTGFSALNIMLPYAVMISTPRSYNSTFDMVAITFNCYHSGAGGNFPTFTTVFDLEVTSAIGAPETVLKVIEDDAIYGPPRFFFGTTGMAFGCGSVFPLSPVQWPGDLNGDGNVNGIDVVFFVNYLHGGIKPIGRYFWNIPCSWNY